MIKIQCMLLILSTCAATCVFAQSASSLESLGEKVAHAGDYATAYRDFSLAAKQGNAKAEYQLGLLYELGEGVPENYVIADKWYFKAADQGQPDALYELSEMYKRGEGVPQSRIEAYKWCLLAQAISKYSCWLVHIQHPRLTFQEINRGQQEALMWKHNHHIVFDQYVSQSDMVKYDSIAASAMSGDVHAQQSLGALYEYGSGHGVVMNYAKAFHWYSLAAKQADAKAEWSLGYMYLSGDGIVNNTSMAEYWYAKAAKQDAQIAAGLGELYESGNKDGIGLPQNYEKAAYWYQRSAMGGNAEGEYDLGILYSKGLGVGQNSSSAAAWFTKAAMRGFTAAERTLGLMYMQGVGVKQNYSEAAVWLMKAVTQYDSVAAVNLGILYYYGEGVPQSYATASKYYLQAARFGNVKALYLVAKLGEDGIGEVGNVHHYLQALDIYKSIVDNYGSKSSVADESDLNGEDKSEIVATVGDAEYAIGDIYYNGKGVSRDYVIAAEYWLNAANQGNAQAQYAVGQLYGLGNGVKQNFIMAVNWYLKAADNGNVDALDALSEAYKAGKGVHRSNFKAYMWCLLAKAVEYNTCDMFMDTSKLSHQQINLAQKEATDWFNRHRSKFTHGAEQ